MAIFIIVSVAAFILWGADLWNWAQKFEAGTEYSATIVFTNLFAFILGVLLTVVAYFLGAVEPMFGQGDPDAHKAEKRWRIGRNLFVILIGAIMGWGMALAYTPFGATDAESLSTIIKTLSVFLSGYVISKADRLLEGSLFREGKPSTLWVPLGLFAAAFLLSAIVVFVNRVYSNDVHQNSVLSFNAPAGNTALVFGLDRIGITNSTLFINGVEIKDIQIKPGDFVKLAVVTRELEINGYSFGRKTISATNQQSSTVR